MFCCDTCVNSFTYFHVIHLGLSTVSIQTDNGNEFQVQIVQPTAPEKQNFLPAATLIQFIDQHYSKLGLHVPSILLQSLMYYKYQEDFDAFAPQAIQNLRLLPYYSSALNLISHPAFPKELKVYDAQVLGEGFYLCIYVFMYLCIYVFMYLFI